MLALTGANNASNSAGTVAGSRMATYRAGIMIFVAGLAAGAVLEGGKLSTAVTGGALSGTLGANSIAIILWVSLSLIILANTLRLPLPITQAVFGASIGSAFFLGVPINMPTVSLVIASWLITPFMAMLVSFVAAKSTQLRPINSVGGSVAFYGILTMAASFYTAYAFGANTLGLVIGVMKEDLGWPLALSVAVLAASAGSLLGGERVARTVGERVSSLGPSSAFTSQLGAALTIHFFTQGGIPVSISHAIIGSVSGTGLSRGSKALSRKTALKLTVLWVATPLLAFGMAWLLQAASL
ncbi:MAG: inorganic phosphate transporter [Candidatus Methanomethylicia archaeon]|nr:inorganic phosphate transporter [Candidatus Methanomethylicia archaeon]